MSVQPLLIISIYAICIGDIYSKSDENQAIPDSKLYRINEHDGNDELEGGEQEKKYCEILIFICFRKKKLNKLKNFEAPLPLNGTSDQPLTRQQSFHIFWVR